jgi:hypothetical protein
MRGDIVRSHWRGAELSNLPAIMAIKPASYGDKYMVRHLAHSQQASP